MNRQFHAIHLASQGRWFSLKVTFQLFVFQSNFFLLCSLKGWMRFLLGCTRSSGRSTSTHKFPLILDLFPLWVSRQLYGSNYKYGILNVGGEIGNLSFSQEDMLTNLAIWFFLSAVRSFLSLTTLTVTSRNARVKLPCCSSFVSKQAAIVNVFSWIMVEFLLFKGTMRFFNELEVGGRAKHAGKPF